MQSRDGDLREFFAREIQFFPLPLSDLGKLHLPSTKSELLTCTEQPGQPEPPPTYDCKVLHGAVIFHCLPTTGVSTFSDYADNVFLPYLFVQLQGATMLDVWDKYLPDSLKESTREKKEGRVCAEKCQAKPTYQAIGRTSSVIQTTRRNCLPL